MTRAERRAAMLATVRREAIENDDDALAMHVLLLESVDPHNPRALAPAAVTHFATVRRLGEMLVGVAGQCAEGVGAGDGARGVAVGAGALEGIALAALRVAREMRRAARAVDP